ncbi:phosphotransferase enzyme family protein [Microvirga sp. VF16]|uniref:phosphotransferase enzyme family protein n=1 Tax=Microvirga sp. VF16 TaxID=2807101 RepID=UPI00193CFAB5|nr:phosphotransferase [Microvirga sp. VF16]QRM32705.1 phosphotransferase [Microvirga sp. VF16]
MGSGRSPTDPCNTVRCCRPQTQNRQVNRQVHNSTHIQYQCPHMVEPDLASLSQRYASRFTAIELVVGGVNRTYRVRDAENVFYLRLYRSIGRSVPEIDLEIRLLMLFPDDAGVEVARPVATADGRFLVTLERDAEPRHACLFEAIQGREMANSPADMRLFGTALATLHSAMPLSLDADMRSLDPTVICHHAIKALGSIGGSQPLIRTIERECLPAFQNPGVSRLPAGLCHGDAWPGNVRVRDGKVGFFDFDDFDYGPLIIDLGTAAWHRGQEGGQARDEVISALVSGYETARSLSAGEKAALPPFIKLAEIRSLLFLAQYCALTEEMWSDVFNRAHNLLSVSHNP